MKFLTLLVMIVLSVGSLHASECKYLISDFVGSYKLENYKCVINDDTCYSEQDEYSSVKEILIMPYGLGYGIGISIKLLDKNGDVVIEHFISERSTNQNEVVTCNQSEQAGLSIKSEMLGRNGSGIFLELTLKENELSVEHFVSLAGVESLKILSLKRE